MANYFSSMYSPTIGVMRGQQVEQGMGQAELEGIALRDLMAARRAAARMGSGNYFAGFEGMEGAERPDYLKDLYAEGDPETALKMEQMLATPHMLRRGIGIAGDTEEAKKSADYRAMKNAFPSFFSDDVPQLPPEGGGGMLPISNTEAPSIPGGSRTAASGNLMGYSGDERSVEFGPTGPKIGVKRASQFDKAAKATELGTEGRRVDITKDRFNLEAVQAAHENVRKTSEEIAATQKAMQNRDMEWEPGRQKIAALNQQLQTFTQQRDRLLSGGQPQAAPASSDLPAGAPSPVSPALGGQVPPAIAPKFTYKEQGQLEEKNRTERMTAANKEIENARLGAAKVNKFKRQIVELFDLVTKQDIGHPTLEGIPGAANALSMSRANAQVKKLNEGIINMFAEPGQSQMMNTIVERQMQGAVVPSLFTDPQLNKINAAIIRSNVEHLSNFPSFLEKWTKTHNNTLEGAAEEWLDYTAKNPLYTYTKDARGRVAVRENSHVMPIDRWLGLKATGGVRNVGGKTFIRERDGSWVEK